ncbi:MAG: tRNA (N6-threonylcarbamoyladenosine(37)-N6)-methyltransferase TrmO [Lachnospiraceae bacterium]|nr:tRNA (N6-threonylcarbamoyladenosine(37)-N6)-methyltransferase TrmO [Lachnospiraceae bacterium]
MEGETEGMKSIAYIHTDFPEKFGIPRQSGLVDALKGQVVFEPEYRSPEAVRGLEQFSHIWLLWQFSESKKDHWSATVKPPRLGGKKRVGVFASRSPYRPNGIGLSCVRLERIEITEKFGPVLYVAGVDLLDKTPIYDIKPYIPMSDCHPEALEGYTKETRQHRLSVDFPKELLALFPEEKQRAILGILAEDPRPAYVQDEDRIYGVSFGGYNVKFRIAGETAHVCKVENAAGDSYNPESFHKI